MVLGLVLAPALLATAAHAQEVPVVRWLVPADGAVETWRGAAAMTWPGGLSVRVWDGCWPPPPGEVEGNALPVAYLDGALQDGVLVIHGREESGTLRLPLRFPDASDDEAMRSVLLILRSSVEPLAVEDTDREPILLPPPSDLEPTAAEIEAPVRRGRVRGGVALGISYRPGLDTASLAPRGRLALVLGPLETSPLRLSLWGGADLVGKASIGGVPVREDEGFAAVGVELRPRWRQTQIPLAVAAGARIYRAIRTDRALPKKNLKVRPTVVFGGGPSWALADGLRLELLVTASVELVRSDGGAPIQLWVTSDDQRVPLELFPLRVGVELGIDLGEPHPRRAAPPKKSDTPAVRPPDAATPNGAEG
jgi:hypothetical protein